MQRKNDNEWEMGKERKEKKKKTHNTATRQHRQADRQTGCVEEWYTVEKMHMQTIEIK